MTDYRRSCPFPSGKAPAFRWGRARRDRFRSRLDPGAARRARPDPAALDRIDGRGLREELDEAVHRDQLVVDDPALGGQALEDRLGGVRRLLGVAGMDQRPAGDPGQQAFQVGRRRQLVGVFLRDPLALFGVAQLGVGLGAACLAPALSRWRSQLQACRACRFRREVR